MTEDPAHIVTPSVDPGITPDQAATNGHAPTAARAPAESAPPASAPPPVDPFPKLEGDIGLIYRELGDISAGVAATRLMVFAAFGVLVLAVVLMARTATRASVAAAP